MKALTAKGSEIPEESLGAFQSSDRDLIAANYVWFISTLLWAASAAPSYGERVTGSLIVYVIGVYALVLGLRYLVREVLLRQIVSMVLLGGLALAVSLLSKRPEQELRAQLDLYLVFLLAVPAFLRCWKWQLQMFAGAGVVVAVLIACLLGDGGFIWSSLMVSAATGILSTLACKVLDDRGIAERSPVPTGEQSLSSSAWHVFILQAGLLFVLLILDLGFSGHDRTFSVVAKLYGVLVVILGALLAASTPQRGFTLASSLTTFILALMLSLSRLHSSALSAPTLAPLPFIFLSFVSLLIPLTLSGHLALLSAMILGDLTVKSATFFFFENLGLTESVGSALTVFSLEIVILCAGMTLAVVIRILVAKYRERRFLTHLRITEQSLALAGDAGKGSRPFQRTIGVLSTPAKSRQLLFGLFCLGLISNVVTTKLLLIQYQGASGPVLISWLFFLSSWFVLVYQQSRLPAWPPIWFWGAGLCFLLLLWPTLLLLGAGSNTWLWLFWPLAVVVAFGFIPWSTTHMVPLLVLVVAIGAEVVIQKNYQTPGWCLLFGSILVGLLLSKQNVRRLRDQVFFDHFSQSLSQAGSPAQVLRTLSDYLMELLDAQSAIVLTPDSDCEIIVDNQILPFSEAEPQLRRISFALSTVLDSAPGIRLKLIHDLPPALRTVVGESATIQLRYGLLIEVDMQSSGEGIPADDHAEKSQGLGSYMVAILTTWPVYELAQSQELSLAGLLVAITRLRIFGFENDAQQLQQRRRAESQLLQREYELSTLVHDINNTVQDLTLLCEGIVDGVPELLAPREREANAEEQFIGNVQKIALIARSVATVVSDAKRSRELEKFQDLTPREIIHVCEVVREIASFAAIRAERKRITVALAELPEEEVYVMVSMREHLETILRNLLNNSILYSEPGSRVEIRVRASEQSVFIDIADSGRGLSPEECETIFLPGVRGKSSGTTPGLGIGLAESRRFAEAAGGRLTATSTGSNQGAKFTVELPKRERPLSSGTAALWALLVDDQPALTDFYAKIARAHHLQSAIAGSVGEALEIVKQRGRPGLVITDIHLGNGDGLDLVRKLREEFGNSLPIVVISGISGEEALQRVRAAGATDFVAKPVGQRALFARIQSLLS